MRRLLAAILLSLLAWPASADFTAKDASLATVTFKNASGACTAVVCVPQAAITDSTGTTYAAVPTVGADAQSNTASGLLSYARNLVFNGTTWDRWTGAITAAALPLPAGAATSALQGTANTSLSTIATNTGTVATGAATSALQTTANTTLSTIATNTGAAIPAGTNLIGKVGIDQTTPGTTNGVQVNAALPAGTNSIGQTGVDPSSGKGTPSSVAINVSTATTTQLVALSGSTAIYVTSYDVIAGGTGNITFEYGTGASCGTGTTALTGPYNLTAQAGIAKGSGVATILKVPSGNALCVLTSAAVQMSGSVSFQQF